MADARTLTETTADFRAEKNEIRKLVQRPSPVLQKLWRNSGDRNEVKMNKALLSSVKMDWRTPKDFFQKLDQEFHFGLDAAATSENAKCRCFFTPEMNGLSLPWSGYGAVFCNPPYGREIGKWVQKAYSEHVRGGVTIAMLIPARTDTSYFHDYIYGKAEIRFLRGRLKFEDENGAAMNPAPFPSMVVIYRK